MLFEDGWADRLGGGRNSRCVSLIFVFTRVASAVADIPELFKAGGHVLFALSGTIASSSKMSLEDPSLPLQNKTSISGHIQDACRVVLTLTSIT